MPNIQSANYKSGIIKRFFSFINKKLTGFINFFNEKLSDTKRSLIIITVLSFVLNILLELSLRHNPLKLLSLIFTKPHVFLLGVLIVFTSLTMMYIFKRRSFVFILVTVLWTVVTIVNAFLMVVCSRSTPFQSSDLRIFNTAFEIIKKGYLEIYQMVLLVILVALIIAFLVFAFIKSEKTKGLFGLPGFFSIQVCAFTLAITIFYTNTVVSLDKFDNPPSMFKKHGYVFCFLYSILDIGIDKPYGYSLEHFDETRKVVNERFAEENPETEMAFAVDTENSAFMDEIYQMVIDKYKVLPNYPFYNVSKSEAESIISQLSDKQTALKEKHENDAILVSTNGKRTENIDMPNIIFLQLESFYDVENIENFSYSERPHPIYSKMKAELPGGKLTVPSIGAGTANVEFEVMTGMNRAHFGFGEYPYLSVLQNQTCESMAYNAKEYGYKSHVVHNNSSTFYDRHRVFPHLGFDTFISLENMHNIELNPQKWCKDISLIHPIIKTLKSTDQQDLIYTISVQPHGQYPSKSAYENLLDGNTEKIHVRGYEDYPELYGFSYYVNQLNEVDTFIGQLLLELSYIDEPTILIIYGDHLPAFTVQEYWRLKEGDHFQTDYIIWNNCGIEFEQQKDLTTYQLCSYIFSKVGINSGDVNKLNRIYLDDSVEDYHEFLETYQYAIFYDEKAKDPSSPIRVQHYEPSDMTLGYIH